MSGFRVAHPPAATIAHRIIAENSTTLRMFSHVRYVDGVPVVDLTRNEAAVLGRLVEPFTPKGKR